MTLGTAGYCRSCPLTLEYNLPEYGYAGQPCGTLHVVRVPLDGILEGKYPVPKITKTITRLLRCIANLRERVSASDKYKEDNSGVERG